ncbi:DMT family transporter [Phytopseudomonas dryadis]|uniref:EamA family transporter n=1 Tax=Phytopseudomonas dryadis TaxID=2487520 RepID=A0A4Q9R7S0_9GAMM|nr:MULTISPECIES: EamA family transporter [Pseudomonas]TBU96133.1 EamA family transporter [Pseudomonas dryadis]TBV01138.1 EamA family transporter [Pseudomonas dryadis]TBV13848.1 EamA family transporter [Pseudomonas sp. FRB 230]
MTSLIRRSPSRLLQVSDVLLLLVALVWGTSYGVAKQALAFYPVLGFLAVRFGLTFLILLPQLRGEGRKAWAPGVPLGGVMLAIFLCETYGVLHTTASNAAFLISLCVVLTPFVEWRLLGQKPDARLLPAVGLSLLGTWLLSGGIELQLNLGDGLMLLAALLRALLVCLTGRLTAHTQVPALALTAVQTGVIGCGCLLLGVSTLPGGLPALPREPAFWVGTLYLVLFATLFAFFVQNYALRRSSPTRVSLLMGSEPLFGALFAVLWLSERLTVQAWVGGLLIVAATLWTSLLRR